MQEKGEGESESLEDLQMQFEELFLRPDTYARGSSSSSSSFRSGVDEAGKTSKTRGGRK
jgi:hypothetical protein